MTTTVEPTQSDLTRLIRLAVKGEEIVITESGQAVAKLVGISAPAPAPDRKKWLESLRQLRESNHTGKPGKTSDEILAEDRAERD
jgi:antitoxin (DNA-binding transcriptional repressor) of toxin-antitoxin stability system